MAYTVTAYSGDKITVGSVNSRNEFTTNVDAGMRGDTGYSGSLGYTGSQGVGYTGSQGIVGYTGSQGQANTDQLLVNTLLARHIEEYVMTYVTPSGVLSHNYSIGNSLLLVRPSANVLLSISSMDIPVNFETTVKTSIIQESNSTAIIDSLAINGTSIILRWEDGVIPSGTLGGTDDIEFKIFRFSNTAFIARASTKSYSQIT